MKYLKTFESKRLQVGDYVICSENNSLDDFLNNNIGKYISYNEGHVYDYCISYDDIPQDLEVHFTTDVPKGYKYVRYMKRKEIIHSAKHKKDLEYLVASQKYNL